MDQATLVNLDVHVGLEVLKVLEASRIKISVALWMLSPEYSDWRLVLSSSSLDQSHPLKAYDRVADILYGHPFSTVPPILILATKNPFIRELRKIFGGTKNVEGMRLGGQTIGNRFISDAYVYRVQ